MGQINIGAGDAYDDTDVYTIGVMRRALDDYPDDDHDGIRFLASHWHIVRLHPEGCDCVVCLNLDAIEAKLAKLPERPTLRRLALGRKRKFLTLIDGGRF